jgi:hypothetical protein
LPWQTLLTALLLAAGMPAGARCAAAAEQKSELTLPEFRALVREHSQAEKLQANLESAREVLSRLLAAQGEEAAARQSLDRLSGWRQAAQARFQAQNAPASDVELLRFAAAKAAASVAQFEAERREALRDANLLLARAPDSALVALADATMETTPGKTGNGTKDKKEEPASAPTPGPSGSTAAGPELGPDIASRKAQFEKELLPLGNELLSRMYQSYLFGGVPLAVLLWQEQEVYKTELQYRQLLAEALRLKSDK